MRDDYHDWYAEAIVLREQVKTLTKERDEARRHVETLWKMVEANNASFIKNRNDALEAAIAAIWNTYNVADAVDRIRKMMKI